MSESATRESWEFRLSQAPGALWPILSDLPRLHEALDLPRFVWAPAGAGAGGRRIAQGLQGARGLVWEERPVEWIDGQWWRLERRFSRGPLSLLETTLVLRRSAGGGSIAQFQLTAEPNGVLGRTMISSGYVRRIGEAFMRRAEEADDFLAGRRSDPFAPRDLPRAREIQAEAARRLDALDAAGPAAAAARALAELVIGGADADAAEMRPKALARRLKLDDRAVIEGCAAAARAGLIRPRHLAICPLCRRAIATADGLERLPLESACDENGRAPVDLGATVEVVFAPDPALRPVETGMCAAESPAQAPHVLARQLIPPGERRAFPYRPPPGPYRVAARAQPEDGRTAPAARVAHDFAGGAFPVIVVENGGVALGGAPADGALVIVNHAGAPQLVWRERRDWRRDALSGLEWVLRAGESARRDPPRAPMGAGAGAAARYALTAGRAALAERLGELEAAHRLDRLHVRAAELARAEGGALERTDDAGGLAIFTDPAAAFGFACAVRAASAAALRDRAGDPVAATARPEGLRAVDAAARAPALSIGIAQGRLVASSAFGRLSLGGALGAEAAALAARAPAGTIALDRGAREAPAVAAALGGFAGWEEEGGDAPAWFVGP
ncbi:MAG: hypothetical protein AAFR16_04280 [Pseudomonadota bacterium]